jgi:hypothetical protein
MTRHPYRSEDSEVPLGRVSPPEFVRRCQPRVTILLTVTA